MKNSSTPRVRKSRRQPLARANRGMYELARKLDALRKTETNGIDCTLLADVMALWARFMLEDDPSFAGTLYRELNAAWRNRRTYVADGDERDWTIVAFNTAIHDRAADLFGEKRGTLHRLKQERAERLESDIKTLLRDMHNRTSQAVSTIEIPSEVETEIPAEVPDDDNVVDLLCWIQSRPRPIRNLLFAEKEVS